MVLAGKCSVCHHKKREEIDKQLVSGVSLRDIAKQHQLSVASVHRHKSEHISDILAKSEHAKVIYADNLLEQLNDLQLTTIEILNDAKSSGDTRTALQAISQARNNIELYSKISGEYEQHISLKTQNDASNPAYFDVPTILSDPKMSELVCYAAKTFSKQKKLEKSSH